MGELCDCADFCVFQRRGAACRDVACEPDDTHPVGIVVGLVIGKQLGVFGAAMAAIKLRIAKFPEGASSAQFYGIAILTGVGFTMSLFIGTLAFENESLMAQVRLGVLEASILSSLIACLVLVIAARGNRSEQRL